MTKRLYQMYLTALSLVLVVAVMITPALAVEDMWTVANRIIVDVYAKIVSISTVLAGLMSAIAVIGAKLSKRLIRHGTGSSVFGLRGLSSTASARSSPMLLRCSAGLRP